MWAMDVEVLMQEVSSYLENIMVGGEGEHLWDNYQEIAAINLRLQQIHNDIAYLEIQGKASQELKKFRTMVIDPTIERIKEIASFESRKITARQIEYQMEKG